MTPEYKTALIRGVITGVFLAGSAFCAIGAQWGFEAGAWAAGTAFFGSLIARGGVEGSIDSKRANTP